MTDPAHSDITLRGPKPDETGRIAHLFRNLPLPAEAQILAAVRAQPVERFLAAVACWPEGDVVRFRLACQPGMPRLGMAKLLLGRVEESARRGTASALHYAESLADENEWLSILRECGFECLHSERFFEVPAMEAWTRVMQIFKKHATAIPNGWRTESIRRHQPELALDVIGNHRLMQDGELKVCWREGSHSSFDLDLSSFLFDGPSAVGTVLTRRSQDALCIDVRVVRIANPRLRALGNACLLYHMASRCDPRHDSVRWLRFRAGETEHRETANLAFRMKGRELPPRHLLAKKL